MVVRPRKRTFLPQTRLRIFSSQSRGRWTGRRHGVGPVKRPLPPKALDWHAKLPRPVYDERPELVEFYDKAWEIAHTRIDNIPRIPVPDFPLNALKSLMYMQGLVYRE